MACCIVTGGAGFIGSNLVKVLLQENASVRILDNFSTGKRENIEAYKKTIEIIEGDVRDYHTVSDSLKGSEIVFHQGALPSVLRSVECPQETNDCNITGTLHVLRAAAEHGIKRVIFASSSSVYGDTPVLPKKEDMLPLPLSPYALSKLTGEYYCSIFNDLLGVETISLRYFNVYGPLQDPDSEYAAVVPKFISKMIRDEPPVIFGDGEQSRDFTFVRDVVQANIKAAKAKVTALGKVFNIAGGTRISVNHLVEVLNVIMDKDLKAIYEPPRPGDVKHSLADVGRAHDLLGFQTKTEMKQGLLETVEWFQSKEPKIKK